MFTAIARFFGFSPSKKIYIKEPAIGEKWLLKSYGPWPSERCTTATILDVKDGWVRYDMGYPFRDERMKMRSFLYCYSYFPEAQRD